MCVCNLKTERSIGVGEFVVFFFCFFAKIQPSVSECKTLHPAKINVIREVS